MKSRGEAEGTDQTFRGHRLITERKRWRKRTFKIAEKQELMKHRRKDSSERRRTVDHYKGALEGGLWQKRRGGYN